MRYRLRDVPALLASPAGWMHVRGALEFRLWPLSSRVANLYRRTIVRSTRIVAVVGSSGKSTTLRAVCAALAIPPSDTMLFNAWGSISRALLRIARGQRHAALEVAIADKGQMQPYSRMIRPDVTVVTAIGSEHHRSLGTLDVTRDEKAWMVRALSPAGTAVLNGDDTNVMWMKSQTRARVVTYGFDAACDVRAVDARLDWPHGTRLRIVAPGIERQMSTRLVGRHMVYPVLAAIAVSQVEAIPIDDAIARLESLTPTPGRMQPVALPGGAMLLRDEYKSPIETIHAALDTLAEVPARRRIVLMGDVSEPRGPQRAMYQALGERIARIATHLLVIGGMYESYYSGARRGSMPKANIIDAGRTPRTAAQALAGLLEPGDVLLVKGRDTQMLDRVRLILQGRTVRCDIRTCNLRMITCECCPILEPGWGKHRVVMMKGTRARHSQSREPDAADDDAPTPSRADPNLHQDL